MKIEKNEAKIFPLSVDDLEVGGVYEAHLGDVFLATDEDTIVTLGDGVQWSALGDEGSYAASLRYREVDAKLVIS